MHFGISVQIPRGVIVWLGYDSLPVEIFKNFFIGSGCCFENVINYEIEVET